MNCRRCERPLAEIGTYKPTSKICKECQLKQQSDYRNRLRDQGKCTCGREAASGKKSCSKCLKRYKLTARQSRKGLKEEVFAAYGDRCRCCGEQRPHFLTIDHIVPYSQGGGPRDRRGGPPLYRWLKSNNYPDGFRLLCMNCNSSRVWHSYCPHQTELSFADFAVGGRPHMYIRMNTPMRKAMDKVQLYCETTKTDINAFMEPIVVSFLEEAMEKLDAYEPPEDPSSENPF